MQWSVWSVWCACWAAAASARELDPAVCAARFDVQRDKIIRTEESRDMGARYLSELDVGTRPECLRLCCETDACDVFVYDEKGPGSCYLFKCGPPEDFRCKFTAHSNFSSGVLAVSRSLAELQDQEQRAHHERELANLRSATSSRAPPAAPRPAPRPAPSLPPLLHTVPPTPSRCSWNQFECRHGGECIAVYNACDGVAQCADGSDEPPELACPPPPSPAPALAAAPTTPRTAPPPPQLPPPQTLKPMQEEASVPLSDSLVDGDRWPHRLTQAQPPRRYNTESGPSSHIFSHKGGLLQEPEGGAQFPAFEPPWQRRPWTPQNGVGSVEERGWAGGAGYGRLGWPEPDLRRAWPVPQPRPDTEMQLYMGPKTMPEVPMLYSSQQQTLRDAPKKGLELLPPTAHTPPPAPDLREENKPTHVENTTKKKVIQEPLVAQESSKSGTSSVEEGERRGEAGGGRGGATSAASKSARHGAEAARHGASAVSAQHADDHDGLSEHPPAAVLLLVLGVSLTAVLGALLACRARASRRRLRRKSALAHDADYLVNGMYL